MTAAVTLIQMAAKGGAPAYLNSMHGTQLVAGQIMGFTIVGAALTEDIRHLDAVRWPHRASSYDYAAGSGALSRGLVTCEMFNRLTWR